MGQPPFTMSKYVSELDLQRYAREYYQTLAERFEAALIDITHVETIAPTLTCIRTKKIARKALTKD